MRTESADVQRKLLHEPRFRSLVAPQSGGER